MKRLRELREANKISLKKLAADMKLSPSTLSCYESDKRQPTPATLGALADYFDVSVDYLLGRTDDPGAPQAPPPDPQMAFGASLKDGMSYEDLTPEAKGELYKYYQYLKQRYPKNE